MLLLKDEYPPPSRELAIYYARDPLLENLPVVVFFGPSTTGNTTSNSSRIQAYVFSLAGFQHFPRLTVAPNSPLYAAVHSLPSDLQGDEISRGLAVSMLSYFGALPSRTKTTLGDLAASRRPDGLLPQMFDEVHAGNVVSRMELIEDGKDTIMDYLASAVSRQSVSWLDVDVVLPAGSIRQDVVPEERGNVPAFDDNGCPVFHYGRFDSAIQSFGSSAFLPTTKLKRAPSRPPPHSRSRVLSKEAKISLRREMCEFVDTEVNYVSKLAELAKERENTPDLAMGTRRLIPAGFDDVLHLSADFSKDIQSILEATEDDAIYDIECAGNDLKVARSSEDPTGAVQFAQALLRWFPKFQAPYQDYLRTSTDLSETIAYCSKDVFSPTARLIRNMGEQRLRSILIEPVQRLPRYNLIIDNIVSLLPAMHPSLPAFLKARDTVKDICSLDLGSKDSASQAPQVLSVLVSNWSEHCAPNGRLLTAVDISELFPPYGLSSPSKPGVLLLFIDKIVILRKEGEKALTARGIVAEIDRPTFSTRFNVSLRTDDEGTLRLCACFDTSQIEVTESQGGSAMHLKEKFIPNLRSQLERKEAVQRAFKVIRLHGQYEGKTPRLSQEICMAKMENRFAETIRDSGHWALRTDPGLDLFGVVAAIYESDISDAGVKPSTAPGLQILCGSDDDLQLFDKCRENKQALYLYLVPETNERFRLSAILEGRCLSRTDCSRSDLSMVLLKEIQKHYASNQHVSVRQQVLFSGQILQSLPYHGPPSSSTQRSFRPISPVKMISKMLGGQGSLPSTPIKAHQDRQALRNAHSTSERAFQEDFPDSLSRQSAPGNTNRVTVVAGGEDEFKSPLALLEDTFTAYLIGLHSQSGNVVGMTLRNRATVDELRVNDIYNTLLEDPSRVHTAADMSIDVLFSAFEKFLRRAWRERMGPLVPPSTMSRLQSGLDKLSPTAFADEFKAVMGELSPQNRRAFARLVKVLADLLDASGNDADRGALIASFAEAIVLVGRPHDSITLLNRLVEDHDSLFEEIIDRPGSSGSASSSVSRNRSFNKGSFNSHSSSLRKRLGFGGNLSRENSKSEPESKVASLIRSWGKSAKNTADELSQQGNGPKITLVRSKSTDLDPRKLPMLPVADTRRAAPIVPVKDDEIQSRPENKQNKILVHDQTPKNRPESREQLPRRKRRSSLSDLTNMQDSTSLDLRAPLQPRNLNLGDKTPLANHDSSNSNNVGHKREGGQLKDPSGVQTKPASPQGQLRSRELRTPSYEVNVSSSYGGGSQRSSPSKLPSVNIMSDENLRPGTGTAQRSKKAVGHSDQKTRAQSPHKIREQLDQTARAVTTSTNGFQSEIDQIGREMSQLKLQAGVTMSSSNVVDSSSLSKLSLKLDRLSENLVKSSSQQATTLAKLRQDLDKSLLVADQRARSLEELYKEANAENEALYERFNEELERVLGKVRRGEGVQEMQSRLGDALKEISTLRGERARFKKDLADLRSQMTG